MITLLIKVKKAGTGKLSTINLPDVTRIEEDEIKIDGTTKDCVTIHYNEDNWVKVDENFEELFRVLKKYKEGI